MLRDEWQRFKAEVRTEGCEDGVRQSIMTLCQLLGVAVSEQQKAELTRMPLAELKACFEMVATTRSWPNEN